MNEVIRNAIVADENRTERVTARIALSLFTSAKRVERLPTVREWSPRETVRIVTQDHTPPYSWEVL